MGSITSGVGLISGMDIQSIVNQLLSIEARPRDLLLARVGKIDAQRTAYLDVSARFTALLGRVQSLSSASAFRTARATSSNADVLTATATASAATGSYSFTVRSLASAHQMLSGGFTDRTAPLPGGVITIESARARVDRGTPLAELNGYRGVQRGRFELTNGAGVSATIDIGDAQSLSDVADRITAADIGVQARVTESGLVLTDASGGSAGLRISELDGGHVAADLGFALGNQFADGANATLTGSNLAYLSATTPLSALNDGLGVRAARAGGDFTIQFGDGAAINVDLSETLQANTRIERLNGGNGASLGVIRITGRNGLRHEVDLTGLNTIGAIKQRIEEQSSGISVVLSGDKLLIRDTTQATNSPLRVEDVSGTAARDLGLTGPAQDATLTGRAILSVRTVGDALRAINFAQGNEPARVRAELSSDGRRIQLRDGSGGDFAEMIQITGDEDSQVLHDLGIPEGEHQGSLQSRRIIGGVNTVLLDTLNGGRGLTGGVIRLQTGAGSVDVDLRNAETLQTVIERINAAATSAGLNLAASHDPTGTRLLIGGTNSATGAITISDVSGNFAAASGLAQTGERLRSGNLQRQYINERTRLDSLNNGAGISRGSIRLTDSRGVARTIDLTSSSFQTLGDVINEINREEFGVRARINDRGDGLLLVDSAGGALPLKIEEAGGNAARDLNVLGQADDGQIDGSFELEFDLGGGMSLEQLAERISQTPLARAEIFNDGSGAAPYRLSITSRATGLDGALLIDAGATGIDLQTLTRAQNATLVVGGGGGGGVTISSSSNTFRDVVPGLTLTANGVSAQPVSIAVSRDIEALVTTLQGFVADFNTLATRLKVLSSYDPDAERAGALLGETALQTAQTRLYNLLHRSFGGDGTIRRLSQIGIRVTSGAQLTFDEQAFRDAYAASPEAVTSFFTDSANGAALKMRDELRSITESGGVIPRRNEALNNQKELLNERVGRLNDLLERKRIRLLRQFQTMEESLSRLQSQGASLSNFSNAFAGYSAGQAGG